MTNLCRFAVLTLALCACDGKAAGDPNVGRAGGLHFDAPATSPAADSRGAAQAVPRSDAPSKPDVAAAADFPAAADAPPTSLADKPALATERAAGLTLIEAGSAPLVAARLVAKRGTKAVVPARLQMVLSVAVGLREVPPTKIPAISVDAIAEVTEVTAKQITLAISTANAVADPQGVESERVRKAVTEAVTDLGGAKATVTIDRKGGPSIMTMDGDADTSRMQPSLDGFFDTLRPLFVALPSDPVGVGAVWEAVSHRDEAGARMQQIVRYEVVSIDDAILRVRWRAERGVLSVAPTDGAGIEAHAAVGQGEVEFDLAAAAPRSGSAEINSRTHAHVNFGPTPSPVMVQQISTLDLGVAP